MMKKKVIEYRIDLPGAEEDWPDNQISKLVQVMRCVKDNATETFYAGIEAGPPDDFDSGEMVLIVGAVREAIRRHNEGGKFTLAEFLLLHSLLHSYMEFMDQREELLQKTGEVVH